MVVHLPGNLQIFTVFLQYMKYDFGEILHSVQTDDTVNIYMECILQKYSLDIQIFNPKMGWSLHVKFICDKTTLVFSLMV